MLAAHLNNTSRGLKVRFGNQGGVIEHAEQRIRGRFDNRGGNFIDSHLHVFTSEGLKHFVLSPRAEVDLWMTMS